MVNRVLNDVGPGHNGGITEGVFFHHMRIFDDLEKKELDLKAKRKAAETQLSNDGLNKKDFVFARKQRTIPQREQMESFERRRSYLQFMKNPTGMAMKSLDHVPDDSDMSEEEREKKYLNDGYVASLGGKGLHDALGDHDPNSEVGRYITKGWEEGQAKNAEGITEGPKAGKKAGKKAGAAPATDASAETSNAQAPAGDAGTLTPAAEAPPAKKRGRPAKVGVSYWHNPEERAVKEIKDGSEAGPGFFPATREEFDKLKAQYDAERDAEFAKAAPADAGSEAAPPPEDDGNDGFGGEQAPAPDA